MAKELEHKHSATGSVKTNLNEDTRSVFYPISTTPNPFLQPAEQGGTGSGAQGQATSSTNSSQNGDPKK